MTLQIRPRLATPARSLALSLACATMTALLLACGDDGGDTVSGGGTDGSATGTGTATGSTGLSPTAPTTTGDLPTGGSGSQSASGSETTADPTTTGTASATGTETGSNTDTTATSTTDTTESSTTNPVQTDTGTTTDTTNTTTGDNTTSTSTTTGDDTTTTDGTTTDGVEPCLCPDIEVPLDDGIFVLSDNSELWKFFPETNEFVELGTFNCGGMANTFSMAVDRLGFAWVMFSSPQGEIWKLDITDVSNCVDPGYNQGQMGINYFGMAFVSNNEADQCDQIYGNTFDGGIGGFSEGPNIGEFLTVDPETLQVSVLGNTDFNGAELTGTGDGRAFMFGGANPAKLVEVDKTNGDFLEVTPLGNLELTNAFAFAFFAGDFYMFTESDNNQLLSKVTHFDYDDSDNNGVKELTTVVTQAPMRIVGAGVSTCAPFVPM